MTMIDDFRVVTRVMTTYSRAVTRPAKDGIAVSDMVGRGKQVVLESLNEGCVSEAMVEGLARFLSFGQCMVSCPEVVPQPHLAHTQTKISDAYFLMVPYSYKFT